MRITRYFRFAFWICILGAAVGFGGRLWYIAAHTETGYQSLGAQWWNATFGLVRDSPRNIGFRPPAEQAQYWLQETERILRDHPGDAALAMGAAWMLDAPSHGFDYDFEGHISRGRAAKQAVAEFEVLCRERCQILARQATERDSSNVNWWQLRALLLFSESPYASGGEPRQVQWRAVLDECARHDPDNALYDYLAAIWIWRHSAKEDFANDRFFMIINDRQQFDEGVAIFERGLSKPHLAINDECVTATAAFLYASDQHRLSHAELVEARTFRYRLIALPRNLWMWQNYQAEAAANAGDIAQALKLHRQNLQAISQRIYSRVSVAHEANPEAMAVHTTEAMRKLAEQNPDAVSGEERSRILGLQRSALLRQRVIERAEPLIPPRTPVTRGGVWINRSTMSLVGIIDAWALPGVIVILFVCGIGFGGMSHWLGSQKVPAIGIISHLMAIAMSLTLTIVFLGLCPAHVIGPKAQGWVFSLLLVALPIVVPPAIIWRMFRKRQFQFSLRALLMSTAAMCLILGLYSYVGLWEIMHWALPFPLEIPIPISVSTLLPFGLPFPTGELAWVLTSWAIYGGPFWTIVLWAVFIVVASMWKSKRPSPQGVGTPFALRLGAVCRALGKPALVMAALLFLAYLVAAAHTLTVIEDTFQKGIAFARNPREYWARVEAAVRSVETDDVQMKEITDWAENEVLVGPQRTTDSGEGE